MAETAAPAPGLKLDDTWGTWVAENLACGVAVDEVVQTLVRRGVPEDRARSYVADEDALRPRRLGPDTSLLRTLASVYNAGSVGIDHLEASDADLEHRFFSDYYRLNRPVVVDGFAFGSPALHWSISALTESHGHHSVLVQAGRGNQVNAFRHGRQRRMALGAYLRSLETADAHATYLTGNDRALFEPGLRSLAQDLTFSSRILDATHTSSHANLWIGGGGATSPLHCDRINVLNLQIVGRKRFLMAHPGSMPDVYSIRGKFSMVDAQEPDLDRFPDFARVRLYEVVLEPSDALLIPVGWWHHVTALEPSVNVSFTNFSVNNEYGA